MPTDEIGKLIVDGDIFIQDKDGQINKIAEDKKVYYCKEGHKNLFLHNIRLLSSNLRILLCLFNSTYSNHPIRKSFEI